MMGPHWRVPQGAVGAIDLRSIPDQTLAGVLGVRPYGFFAVSGTLPSEYTLLGSGDLREIKSQGIMKATWLSLLGYTPRGDTLNELLFDHLTSGSDPTFEDSTPSLMPTSKGILEVHLGGHSLIKSEQFRYGLHSHTNKVQAVLHRNYRQMRADIDAGLMDDGHDRRVLDAWLDKYRISKTNRMAWEQFVPPELRDGHPGPLPHKTIITESFNKADSDTLGPDLTWTDIESDIDVVSNQAKVEGTSFSRSRAEFDLSSNDHYSQVDIIFTGTGTESTLAGCIARVAASAITFYRTMIFRPDSKIYLGKVIEGVLTTIGTPVSITPSFPEAYKLDCNGSTLRGFQAGVQRITTTDTAIPGNLRTGIEGWRSTSGESKPIMDNFEAADLPSGTIVPQIIATYHRVNN